MGVRFVGSYSYHPGVAIYEVSAGCRMKVEDETILVKRIKSTASYFSLAAVCRRGCSKAMVKKNVLLVAGPGYDSNHGSQLTGDNVGA
jgi:hypothetical protein